MDFETLQIEDSENPESKKLLAYQYALVFVDKDNKILIEKRELAPNLNAGELCLDYLLEIEDQLFNHARRSKEMVLTTEDRKVIRKSTHCHICEVEFQAEDKRAYDHCHYR